MRTQSDRGVALILALFLMTALSVLGASLMFLSQTETYASMNYRMMSQARYGGEAAVQKAANFLLDTTQYSAPGSVTDPLGAYDRSSSPVKWNGNPVILSAKDGTCTGSNYPVASVQTAFCNAAKGTMAAGNATVSFNGYAKLVSMQAFDAYGGGQAVAQTWEITGIGGLSGGRSATVEVSATIETPKVSANSYAAFATSPGCDAIYFHGNVTVDSYDSGQGPPSGAGNSHQSSGGDVGTNGNLHIQGSVAVQGNLSTPRDGVGACTEGHITGLTEGGSADVTGSQLKLPTAVLYPLPSFSATPPTTEVTIDAALLAGGATTACTSLGLTAGTNLTMPPGNCTIDAGTKTVTVNGYGGDVTMPTVTVSSNYKLVFVGHAGPAQNVNINSLKGSGDVEISANLVSNLNESVVLKIKGKNPPDVTSSLADPTDMDPPFDLSTMSWKQNSASNSYDASALQIVYPGTGTISMKGGNSQSAATIYAPNAAFSLQGTQDLYGSVLAKTITNGGNASIHYDRRLGKDFYVTGNPIIGTFTWKRY